MGADTTSSDPLKTTLPSYWRRADHGSVGRIVVRQGDVLLSINEEEVEGRKFKATIEQLR